MFPSLSILLQELYPSYQLNLYRINRYSGCCRCLTMAIALCNCNEAQCRCICSQRREENFLTAMAQASLGSQTTCCHLSGEIPTELWNFSLLMQWCCCTCTTMSLKEKKDTHHSDSSFFFLFLLNETNRFPHRSAILDSCMSATVLQQSSWAAIGL